MRVWAMATIGVFALCTATPAAQAASVGGTASALRAATEGSGVEKIAYRRCWWRQGVRSCRRYRSAYYGVPSNQPYFSGSSIGIIMGIQ
jgi:hypothetical protein